MGLFDPFAAITAAAQPLALTVGTYVLNVELWNPLLLARAVATTDLVTDGRLVVGLGAGHAADEFAQAGLRYPSAGERKAGSRPRCQLRRLLAGETVDDERLGLAQAATGLAPVDTPLQVGGNGDWVLDLAGREADIKWGRRRHLGHRAGRTPTCPIGVGRGWPDRQGRGGGRGRRAVGGRRRPRPAGASPTTRRRPWPTSWTQACARTCSTAPSCWWATRTRSSPGSNGCTGRHGVAGVTVFAHDAEALAPVIARLRA